MTTVEHITTWLTMLYLLASVVGALWPRTAIGRAARRFAADVRKEPKP